MSKKKKKMCDFKPYTYINVQCAYIVEKIIILSNVNV